MTWYLTAFKLGWLVTALLLCLKRFGNQPLVTARLLPGNATRHGPGPCCGAPQNG